MKRIADKNVARLGGAIKMHLDRTRKDLGDSLAVLEVGFAIGLYTVRRLGTLTRRRLAARASSDR